MKTLLLLAALVAATAVTTACDRRTGPTESGARAVTGIVELRLPRAAVSSGSRSCAPTQGRATPS